jgi:hypothetical protein
LHVATARPGYSIRQIRQETSMDSCWKPSLRRALAVRTVTDLHFTKGVGFSDIVFFRTAA